MKPHAVIIGAGLGGCTLAKALLPTHEVTVVERGAAAIDPRYPLVDVGLPAVTEPHFGSGLGGSTQLWHNGLIEIPSDVFDDHWPIDKRTLDPYYLQAFRWLSNVPVEPVREAIAKLSATYRQWGLPNDEQQGLFYPRSPINAWETFELEHRVRVVRGDAASFETGPDGEIRSVTVVEGDRREVVHGDVFVLAAGGLGTPVLLQKLATTLPLPSLRHAGRHYEDHPMGFVGEVEVTIPLYRLWNYFVPGTGGNLRLPLIVKRRGMHISFQLRPAAAYYRDGRRERVGSVLNDLRRNPWNPAHYLKLVSHWDDILDILSFKFGIHLPTKHYTLLLVAQMPAADELSIWSELDPHTGREVRKRRWHLSEQYRGDLHLSIDDLLTQLAPVITRSRIFQDWQSDLRTGAHHSGTARMADSPDRGVCDGDCRVFGTRNLYVCDGSVIPASGIANTGLTIAALALRLAQRLQGQGDATASAPAA